MSKQGNINNLVPNENRTPEQRRENAKKAGIASGKSRKRKKETRQILENLLSMKAKEITAFKKVANQLGLDDRTDLHELFTLMCLMNSMKKGDLRDVETLMRIMGDLGSDMAGSVEDLTPLVDLLNGGGKE